MWAKLFRCTVCGMLIGMEDPESWPLVPDENNDLAWEFEKTRHFPDCSFVLTRNYTRGFSRAGAVLGAAGRDSSDGMRGDCPPRSS